MRVLILEDEPLIALDIQAELVERGFEVVGPVGNVVAAMELVAQETLSVAVLDINIGTGHSFKVARALEEKLVPFIFISGDQGGRPKEFGSRPILAKPIDYQKLDRTLRAALT